jgi:hypothetical protein
VTKAGGNAGFLFLGTAFHMMSSSLRTRRDDALRVLALYASPICSQMIRNAGALIERARLYSPHSRAILASAQPSQ